MPYRHAPLLVMLLFPCIALAFWPGYFGQMRAAPFALHAHGITATLWIALVAAQGWTAQRRDRLVLHRATGLAVFVLVPLFAAGGLLAMRDMALLGLADADPFHARYGVALALLDLVAVLAFVGLVAAALAARRRVWSHAGYMLGTVILVLPPVLGRLFPMLPFFPVPGLAGFTFALYLGQLLAAAGALFLARPYRRSARPFAIVGAVLIVQAALFDTVARSDAWRWLAARMAEVPAPLAAIIGMLGAGATLWWAWGRRAIVAAAAPLTPAGSA